MKKIPSFLRRVWCSARPVLPAVALGLVTCGAFAAEGDLPESVTTAITDFQTQGIKLMDAIMPAVKALLIGMFGIVAVWFCYRQVRKVLGR